MNAYGYGNFGYPYFNYGFPQYSGFPNYGGYNLAFQGSPWGAGVSSQANTDVSTSLSGQGSQTESMPAVSTTPAATSTPKTKVCIDLADGIIITDKGKKVSFVETTPEKAEEFVKKCKRNDTIRIVKAVGSMLACIGLSAWLGPKASNLIKSTEGWKGIIKENLSDRVLAGLWGMFAGCIPASLLGMSTSAQKALAKEYFPEANIT